MLKLIFNKYKVVIFPVLGAFSGYLYYYFIGCRSGSCPITSNWMISTLYGAVIGFVLAYKPKEKKVDEQAGDK